MKVIIETVSTNIESNFNDSGDDNAGDIYIYSSDESSDEE